MRCGCQSTKFGYHVFDFEAEYKAKMIMVCIIMGLEVRGYWVMRSREHLQCRGLVWHMKLWWVRKQET
jgi:hypothetical protein